MRAIQHMFRAWEQKRVPFSDHATRNTITHPGLREPPVSVRGESRTISRLTATECRTVRGHICPLTLTSTIHPAFLASIVSSVSISLSLSSVRFLHFTPLRPRSSLSAVTHLPPSSQPMFKSLCPCPRRSLTLLPPSLLVSNLICCYWPSQPCSILPPFIPHILPSLSLSLFPPSMPVSLPLLLME